MSVTQMPLIKQDRHAPTSKPNAGSEPINKEPYQLRTSSSAISLSIQYGYTLPLGTQTRFNGSSSAMVYDILLQLNSARKSDQISSNGSLFNAD